MLFTRVFGDVDSDELEAPEDEDKDMDEFAHEWADISQMTLNCVSY